MYLWPPWTRFEGTAERNRQEWKKVLLQLRKHFKKQKFLAKTVIAIYALWTLGLQCSQPPTKVWAESPVKRRWIANFLCFLFRQNASLRLFFGTRLNNLLRFCNKNTNFQTSNSKITIQNRSLLNKISPQKVPLLLLNAFLAIFLKLSAEVRNCLAQQIFIFFRRKKASECCSGNIDCSLDHLHWFFNKN